MYFGLIVLLLRGMAFPRILPRCCLRYLTFFGINMIDISLAQAEGVSADEDPRTSAIPKEGYVFA
jgi:threonine/homoserine/homoserine lactone efflux protein